MEELGNDGTFEGSNEKTQKIRAFPKIIGVFRKLKKISK
jgi:hypothetical protein